MKSRIVANDGKSSATPCEAMSHLVSLLLFEIFNPEWSCRLRVFEVDIGHFGHNSKTIRAMKSHIVANDVKSSATPCAPMLDLVSLTF